MLFDENCCDTGDTNFLIPRGGQGKMCGSFSSFNPLSSCKGPKLEDDVESFIVMPGEMIITFRDPEETYFTHYNTCMHMYFY